MPIKNKARPVRYVNEKEICLNDIQSVLLLGDSGCRPPTKKSLSVFSKLLNIRADITIFLGDLVFKGTVEEYGKLFEFCRKRINTPAFALAGNHDLPGYYKFCGDSTYAIVLEKYVFILLDNSRKTFADKDVVFLKNMLRKHKGKRFFILFHIPPPVKEDKPHLEQSEWKKIRSVLDGYKKDIVCIFCGHIHAFLDCRLDGYHVFVTGGGGARLFSDLMKDPIKSHHAMKLSNLDKMDPVCDIISLDGNKDKVRAVNIK